MLKIHWFLPTGGDSRDVLPDGDDAHNRPPSHRYLAQIATACDQLGYEAMVAQPSLPVELQGLVLKRPCN